jgi:hypothetical protein
MKNLLRLVSAVAVAAVLSTIATTPSEAARRSARGGATAYDGLWSVLIITVSGTCDRGYRYPVRIIRGRVQHGDADLSYQVYGAVGRGGAIRVTVARGGQSATGYGRLSRNYGSGRWRTSTGQCSGNWTAERRG